MRLGSCSNPPRRTPFAGRRCAMAGTARPRAAALPLSREYGTVPAAPNRRRPPTHAAGGAAAVRAAAGAAGSRSGRSRPDAGCGTARPARRCTGGRGCPAPRRDARHIAAWPSPARDCGAAALSAAVGRWIGFGHRRMSVVRSHDRVGQSPTVRNECSQIPPRLPIASSRRSQQWIAGECGANMAERRSDRTIAASRRNTSEALVPPKPNEFDSTMSICALRAPCAAPDRWRSRPKDCRG